MASIKTSVALTHLTAELRADAAAAAGPDKVVSRTDQAALDPYLAGRADAMRAEKKGARITVDALVARGTADAAAAWAAVNQTGPAYLSKAEVAAVEKADGALGLVTARAVAIARGELAPPPPTTVAVTTTTPGVELTQAGDVFTVRAGAAVPINGEVLLKVDGQEIELRRFAGGLRPRYEDASAPDGYGCEVLSSGVGADGRAEAALRITRDPASWLKQGPALAVARTALLDHVQNQRVHDADWQSSLGLSWSQAVAAGVMQDIAAFGSSPTAEAMRLPDRYVFVDRGPLDLYTEVSVRKHDGKVLNVYVEID